jgi:hypothetical protein
MLKIILTFAASSFKKININTKDNDNRKLEIITSDKNINKTRLLSLLKNQTLFLNPNSDIDFKNIKINVIISKKNITKNGMYHKPSACKKTYIISNIYTKLNYAKKFIITFCNFQDKSKFLELN